MGETVRVWHDTQPLEPDWPGPTRRPRWLTPVSIAAAIAAAMFVVWAAGGFAVRSGRFPLLGAGTTVDTGQLRITLTHAEAKNRYGDEWTITAHGTCTNTSDEPTHISSDNAFAASVPGTNAQADVELLTFGGSTNHTLHLNPRLEPQLCNVSFSFPSSTQLPDYFVLGIWDLEWGDHTLTQNGEQSWAAGNTGVRILLPLRVSAS